MLAFCATWIGGASAKTRENAAPTSLAGQLKASDFTTVCPAPDTAAVLRNPAMGWTIYYEDLYKRSWSDPAPFWRKIDLSGALPYASILYIRVAWSKIEPTEGQYVWNTDANYRALIDGARRRGLKLAFRICENSESSHFQATPEFVEADGAQGYYETGGSTKWSPHLTDPIFRQKWTDMISALALQYDDPSVVDYIDADGTGWYGESGHVDPSLTTSAELSETYAWLTSAWSSHFHHVLLVDNYGNYEYTFAMRDGAIANDGYAIRRDSYASAVWFRQSDQDRIRAKFGVVPVFAEGVAQPAWTASWSSEYSTVHDYCQAMVDQAEYTHANTLDLRSVGDTQVWMTSCPDLVSYFALHGGYRLALTSLTYPKQIDATGQATISSSWTNFGFGYLPNNMRNWNRKYQVAYALLDPTSKRAVYVAVSRACEPSDWRQNMLSSYCDRLSFGQAAPGRYDIGVAIVDKATQMTPAIQLAIIANKTQDGWYDLGSALVKGKRGGA